MGIWRVLGYIYAGFNILGGFALIGIGLNMTTQQQSSFDTSLFSNVFKQIGGLAFIYGGLSGIMIGILLIWALVKSGQIENIDKNIQIIAEWTKSQQQAQGKLTKNEQIFVEDQQTKLEDEEKNFSDLELKKRDDDDKK